MGSRTQDIRNLSATELVQKVSRGSIDLVDRKDGESLVVSNADRTTITALEVRAHLGKFGLVKQMVIRPVGSLSTGERTRLYLALLMLEFVTGEKTESMPEMLVLDEISDNLDVDTVDSLVNALNNFDGAVLCVSHERSDFLERFCNVTWEIKDKNIAVQI